MITAPKIEDPSDDDGSTLLLTIFYGFLALVLILMVVAATSLYLERKRLFTLADGAALAGAEAFDLADVTRTADGFHPQLDSADVSDEVTRFVESNEGVSFEGLAVERAESSDGRSATVQLSAFWRPPIVSLLIPDGVRLDVVAVARSVFR